MADLHGCWYCGALVTPSKPGTYREVVGWTPNRKQGGANRIGMPRPTGRYMHGGCFDRWNAGISPDQESLL